MFERLGVFNAFCTSDVFNLEFQDVTPFMLRMICRCLMNIHPSSPLHPVDRSSQEKIK